MSMSSNSTPMTSPAYPMYHCQQQNMQPQSQQKREKRKYRCRKRSPATIERAKTVRRDKANARERKRMNSLNDALEELRDILPQLPDEPKRTKIETLRTAQEYIARLSQMLNGTSTEYNPPQQFEDKYFSTSSSPYQDSTPCSNTTSPHYPTIYVPQLPSNYCCSYYPPQVQ